MDAASGQDGGVRCGYQTAAEFTSWDLEPVGPSLYVLRAEVRLARTPWLALPGLIVWVHLRNLRLEWTTDEVSVVNQRFEAVLAGEPRLGPKRGG